MMCKLMLLRPIVDRRRSVRPKSPKLSDCTQDLDGTVFVFRPNRRHGLLFRPNLTHGSILRPNEASLLDEVQIAMQGFARFRPKLQRRELTRPIDGGGEPLRPSKAAQAQRAIHRCRRVRCETFAAARCGWPARRLAS